MQRSVSKIKSDHEEWVSRNLSNTKGYPKIKIKRVKDNVPSILPKVISGKVIYEVISGAYSTVFNHEDLISHEEVNLVASFFQELQDWGDLNLDAGESVSAVYRLTELIADLEERGFWVFGAREIMKIVENGIETDNWPVAIVYVIRDTSDAIIEYSGIENK